MWSNINIQTLGLNHLATFLRLPMHGAFVNAVLSPIQSIYDDWYAMRQAHLYNLAHTAQICYLRKSLNDKFDPELRRIYIGNGNSFTPEYIYTPPEDHPRFLGTLFIHSADHYADTGVDYIVFAPADIVAAQTHELKAHINIYNEGVKRYKIEDI